jgi:hypothetical protein
LVTGAVEGAQLAEIIRPHLLSLKQIDTRHRKTLLPILTKILSLLSKEASTEPTLREDMSDVMKDSELSFEEDRVFQIGIELRMNSRLVQDGATLNATRIGEEFERRE